MNIDFANVRKFVKSLSSQLATHGTQVKETRQGLESARTAPLPKSDIKEILFAKIDALAATYDGSIQFAIDRLQGNPLAPESAHGISIIAAAPPGSGPSHLTMEAAILALFKNEVKAAIGKRIDAMPWPPEAGVPLAERPALIAKLEKELAALERDEAELKREAADAGIVF